MAYDGIFSVSQDLEEHGMDGRHAKGQITDLLSVVVFTGRVCQSGMVVGEVVFPPIGRRVCVGGLLCWKA